MSAVVGTSVGSADGTNVGADDGIGDVGSGEGADVGLAVGSGEGTTVGSGEGTPYASPCDVTNSSTIGAHPLNESPWVSSNSKQIASAEDCFFGAAAGGERGVEGGDRISCVDV